ncbi:MAG: IPTL-CTERM sorting domain-containing protein [Candidatus Competibacter sp.]
MNNLTGTLPASLNDLTELRYLSVANNKLTGSIPSLSSLIKLEQFYAGNNQLSGSIPSLSGLTKLEYFSVYSNQLSGSIPSLAGLTALLGFDVSSNQLSGPAPLVPNPNNLSAGDSALCPNFLSPWTGTANDLAWDTATGTTPWSNDCTVNSFPITTAAIPAAGGTVICNPNPVTSGGNSTCTATPKPGYSFANWSGDCSGANCALTNITSAKSVTANFILAGGTAAAIPTLSEWGLILFASLLGLLGIGRSRRRV